MYGRICWAVGFFILMLPIAFYSTVPIHEGMHCAIDWMVNGSPEPCEVTLWPNFTGEAKVHHELYWWEHPLIYTVQIMSGVMILGGYSLLILFANRRI